MQDYEDIGGRHGGASEGGILKRAENLDMEKLVQGGGEEVNSMQGCGEREDVATEGNTDTFEWVDFKRNGEF